MRPSESPSFLRYPASSRDDLIVSICVTCRRYVAAGSLKLLNWSERQHRCENKSLQRRSSHLVERWKS